MYKSRSSGKVVFSDYLDEEIAVVDGKPVTLRDFAVYAVYEEKLVEEQAKVYDDTNTNKYWSAHTNGQFLKLTARDAAINLAIHDAIFYEMAVEAEVFLDEEEKKYLANEQADFWNDLEDEQKEKLALSQDEVDAYLEKMALAQKMQRQQAAIEGKEEADYDVEGSAYEEMLLEHEITKNEEFIDRIDFGNIILEH